MGCDRATLNYQVERYVPTDIFFAPGNINLAIMARLIFWSGFVVLIMEPSEGGCCVWVGRCSKIPEYQVRNNGAPDISRRVSVTVATLIF